MEKKPYGVKIALVCILGVFVLTVCICLVYLVFFKDSKAGAKPVPSETSTAVSFSEPPSVPDRPETLEASSSAAETASGRSKAYEEFVWSAKKNRNYSIPLDTEELRAFLLGGIESVELSMDGTVTLHCTAELGEVYGLTYEVETAVLSVHACPYGNGGFGAVFFVMEDGTVEALSPSAIINDYKIEMITEFGGISEVVSIERMESGELAGFVCATDIHGNVTALDQYFFQS